MKTEAIEYIADLLPDGHLSLPEEIKRKLMRVTSNKVKVIIEITLKDIDKPRHPAFGIWADRATEGDSIKFAGQLRKKIETRND